MADEFELTTINEDGDSWVDFSPGAVSTGYQAQNTNSDANRVGMDKATLAYNDVSGEIEFEVSGPVDSNGKPFVIKSAFEVSEPAAGIWYFHIVAGSSDSVRSVEVNSNRGIWDAAKNAFYYNGNRVLNWMFEKTEDKAILYKIIPVPSGPSVQIEGGLKVGGDVQIDGDLNYAGGIPVSYVNIYEPDISITLSDGVSFAGWTASEFCVYTGGSIYAYELTASGWSQLGNSLSVGSGGNICPLGNRRVAFSGLTSVSVYEFDGTDFSLLGTLGTSTGIAGRMRTAEYLSDLFVEARNVLGGNNFLNLYEYDSGTITLLDSVTVTASYDYGLVYVGDDTFIIADSSGSLISYEWDGNNLSSISISGSVGTCRDLYRVRDGVFVRSVTGVIVWYLWRQGRVASFGNSETIISTSSAYSAACVLGGSLVLVGSIDNLIRTAQGVMGSFNQ